MTLMTQFVHPEPYRSLNDKVAAYAARYMADFRREVIAEQGDEIADLKRRIAELEAKVRSLGGKP